MVGWLAWQNLAGNNVADTQSNDPLTAEQAYTTYNKTTTVPESWKEYKNIANKLSFRYPADWSVRETEADGRFAVSIYSATSANPQFGIYLTGKSLEASVNELVSNLEMEPMDEGADTLSKKEVSKKHYLFNSHKSVWVYNSFDKFDVLEHVLIQKDDENTYAFDPSMDDESAKSNEMILLESIAIQ